MMLDTGLESALAMLVCVLLWISACRLAWALTVNSVLALCLCELSTQSARLLKANFVGEAASELLRGTPV